jgi:hypothetical protein
MAPRETRMLLRSLKASRGERIWTTDYKIEQQVCEQNPMKVKKQRHSTQMAHGASQKDNDWARQGIENPWKEERQNEPHVPRFRLNQDMALAQCQSMLERRQAGRHMTWQGRTLNGKPRDPDWTPGHSDTTQQYKIWEWLRDLTLTA